MIASLCPAALTPARFARRAANPDKKIISARRAQVRPVRSVSRVVTPRAAMCPNPNLGDMSKLPGDPSVVVHTNIAMGDKKLAFMKAASKSVADCLSKPENFVVVAVLDEQDMIWGGEETPCAIITVNSLGGINYANNTKLSGELTALMGEFGVAPDRMYTNFWDIGFRENCGYNGVTFAEGARQAAAASRASLQLHRAQHVSRFRPRIRRCPQKRRLACQLPRWSSLLLLQHHRLLLRSRRLLLRHLLHRLHHRYHYIRLHLCQKMHLLHRYHCIHQLHHRRHHLLLYYR